MPDVSQGSTVAGLITRPGEASRVPILFTTAEPWESFIEKINDCMKGKATSFQLSYRWQGVDVTLTKEFWKAFIHYLNSQCLEHTVLLDTKCSTASINDPIMSQSSA